MAMIFGKIPGLISVTDKKALKAFRNIFADNPRRRREAKEEVKKAERMMARDKRKIFAMHQ